MKLDALRNYCLRKKAVEETLPFDEDTLVFKVMGKIFALASVSEGDSVNLKCEPAFAVDLRERYAEIQPGYHMNKKHWNTVQLDGSLNDAFIFSLVDHSYDLVIAGLPKKQLLEFNGL